MGLIKCNEMEATMIYCDKSINEERKRNAEVNVKNMSESEDRDYAVNDLLSGSQRTEG